MCHYLHSTLKKSPIVQTSNILELLTHLSLCTLYFSSDCRSISFTCIQLWRRDVNTGKIHLTLLLTHPNINTCNCTDALFYHFCNIHWNCHIYTDLQDTLDSLQFWFKKWCVVVTFNISWNKRYEKSARWLCPFQCKVNYYVGLCTVRLNQKPTTQGFMSNYDEIENHR